MLGHLVFCLFACTAGLGLGGAGLRLLKVELPSLLDRIALAFPLGMGLLSFLIFLLAEVGLLHRNSITLLMTCAVFAGIVHVIGHRPALKIPKLDRRAALPLALAGVSLLGSLFVALAPVTDGDALCYHLQVPKVFLERGEAFFDPDLHETIYPLGTENLYAAALALDGPISCRLIHWLLGVSLFLSVSALARPYLGGEALWAGAIAVLTPAISTGMSAPLNDVSLAAFGIASILAWMRWADDPRLSTACLSGLLAGAAAAVKYPGLVLAGTIVFAVVAQAAFSRKRKTLVDAAVLVAGCLVLGSWSYVRAYIYTGNPVFPFFAQTFGGSGLAEVLESSKRPLEPSLFNLLTAIVPMSLDPARFDSFAHQFGPVFVCLAPVLLLLRAPAGVVSQGLLALGFLAICLTARQSTRFVLMVVGPFSVAATWVVRSSFSQGRIKGRILLSLLVFMTMFEAAWSASRCRKFVDVVCSLESTDHYLSRVEPTYVVGKWIGEHLPESVRLIGQDHRSFYIPRRYAMELAHRRRTALGTHRESAEQIVLAPAPRWFYALASL